MPENHDPLAEMDLIDDFALGGTSSPNIGLGWAFTGANVSNINGEQDHPGIRNIATGTTINTIARLFSAPGGANKQHAQGLWRYTFVFRCLQGSLQEVRLGLVDDFGTAPPANGLYLEHDSAVGATWAFVSRQASANQARMDTGHIVVPNEWVRFTMERLGTGGVAFELRFVAGQVEREVIQRAISGVLPGPPMLPGVQIENLEAADHSLDIDYIRQQLFGLVR